MFDWFKRKKSSKQQDLPSINVNQSSAISDNNISTGDIVLDSYYDLLQKAKEAEDLDKIVQYANAIQEREKFLERSERGRKASYSRRHIRINKYLDEDEDDDAEEEESESKKSELTSLKDLDVSNLGEHADEIADAILSLLKENGIEIPSMFMSKAKDYIAKGLKEHPDIVKKLFETLQKYLPQPKETTATVASGGNYIEFDPWHPERYFKESDF